MRAAAWAAALGMGWIGAGRTATPLGADLVHEAVRIPARGYTLAATIVRPREAAARLGAVVLNHGFAPSAEERAAQSWTDFAEAAAVFARRGYAVLLPSRRGFGATGGELAEAPGPCWWPRYQRSERAAADDVMAAYDYARTLPYVDPARMILAGQSAGGMAALFTAGTRSPQGLLAVLSFAGGRGADPDRPGVPCAVGQVGELYQALGASVRAPALFVYAENDRYFGPSVSRLWFERFAAKTSQARYAPQYALEPPFGRNGHFLFTQGGTRWVGAVERFFAAHGIAFGPAPPAANARLERAALD